jgi:hypothetical protein
MKSFRSTTGYTLFYHKSNEILEELKVEPVDEKQIIQITLATCSENEQKRDNKNNAELQTKWMKTTWKTCEETIRRGRDTSI